MELLSDEIVLYIVDLTPNCYDVISRLNWTYRGLLGNVDKYKKLLSKLVVIPDARYWVLPNKWKHGKFYTYYDSGEVSSDREYVDDVLHGKYIDYYPDNVVWSVSYYINGKRHSRFVEYYDSGALLRTCVYVDGLIQGECIWYKSNGDIWYREWYVDNKLYMDLTCSQFE
jgi:hypothetical protein